VIFNKKSQGYAVNLYEKSGGIFVENNYTDFAKDVLLHIYGRISNTDYQMILATGLTSVKLKAPLNDKNGAKSDKDALTDWEEVDTNSEIIKFDANGDIIVPTFAECCAYAGTYTNNEHFYVQEGYEQLVGKFPSENNNDIYANIRVLPIKSDPTHEDSDFDGISDKNDVTKLNSMFKGKLQSSEYNCDVLFKTDFSKFCSPNNKYYNELSKFGIFCLLWHMKDIALY
jgi:hypothetical protein